MHAKVGNLLQHLLYLRGRDQSRAFELTPGVLVTRTPEEVLMIEAVPYIVPAAIAGVIVDHAERCCKFVGCMREAADHHHWSTGRPREPREPAR